MNIYPHMFLLPKTTLAGRGAGDRVLLAGPGRGDAFLLHTEDWSWHRLANRPQHVPLLGDGGDGARRARGAGARDA